MERFDFHAFGRTLDPEQRGLFFQLGAEVECSRSRRLGLRADPGDAHERALAALEAVSWSSIEAARAMLTVARTW